MKKNKKLYITFICFIILIVSTSITKTMQNDTFFTIATGNEIMENGYDNLDHLTFHEGLDFYKLRWAFDVVISIIYNNGGFTGIYIFVIIVACIIGIFLFNILLKQKNNIIVSFIITILAMIFLTNMEMLTARAQIISYLLLLCEVFVLERLVNSKKKIYYFILFLISILLVNFHASVWMMMIILVLPYLAEAIIYKTSKNKKDEKIIVEPISIKLLLIAILFIILGSIFSPIGTYPYTYMFKVIGGISSNIINELKMTNIVTNLGLMIMFATFVLITLGTKTKIKLHDLLMFGGLFIMAIIAIRNNAFFYIIGSMYLANIITEFLNEYDNEKTIEKAVISLQKNKSLFIMSIIVVIISAYNYSYKINQEYVDKTFYPVDAVNFIKENIDYKNLKVFNHLDFGSYIEFCGIPAFVDSRTEIFTKEFNDTNVLFDWWNAYSGFEHYDNIFGKYDIDYAILYNDEIITTYIQKDKNYEEIYKDKYFSVYVLSESNKLP